MATRRYFQLARPVAGPTTGTGSVAVKRQNRENMRYRAESTREKRYVKNRFKPASLPEPKCPLCLTETDDMVSDHCHTTGIPREWVCRNCNVGLGMFDDNPEALERAAPRRKAV